MKKKLYYHLTDTVDLIDLILPLHECMQEIKRNMESASETDEYEEGFCFKLTPFWINEELDVTTYGKFEIKHISNHPEKSGWYYVMNPNKEIMPRQFYFGQDTGWTLDGCNLEFWLDKK